MKGDQIPDGDHVSRLCGGSHMREDGTVSASAFKLRPGEAYLSINWLEHLALPDRQAEIAEVRRVLAAKRAIGPTARLAILNVGIACKAVRLNGPDQRLLRLLHEPEVDSNRPADPSHSGIYGVSEDDNTVPVLLAASIQSVYPAR